jgi:hypothetical protein
MGGALYSNFMGSTLWGDGIAGGGPPRLVGVSGVV